MKRVLISATLLIGMIASAMVFSSFTLSQPIATSSVNSTQEAVYWRGKAYTRIGFWLELKVYQSPNTCNDYYAVVIDASQVSDKKDAIGEKLVVKNNGKKYYVSWKDQEFYFEMK
jgi:hypothetical protein